MKTLSDYIIVINEALTDSLCDAVLNEYTECSDWMAATTVSGRSDLERQCSTIGISFNSIVQKNYQIRKNLDAYLFVSASNVIRIYKEKFSNVDIQEDTGYDLL